MNLFRTAVRERGDLTKGNAGPARKNNELDPGFRRGDQ